MATATVYEFQIDPNKSKQKCPQCAHLRRRHPTDKPLSYDRSRGLYNCHHCGWAGRVPTEYDQFAWRSQKKYALPEYRPQEHPPNEKLLSWFARRGIPADVVARHKIEARSVWMPQTEREERVLAFPYFRNGEVFNVKYRTADKMFRLEKNAEISLYGLDDIRADLPLLFCEGEADKLALEVAGYPNAVSVPNGAGTNLDVLASAEAWLAPVSKFIWAGDNDEAGRRLETEAIRRLGPERCWRAQWPEDCKDAGDVLIHHGVKVLAECIEGARPVPIEGAFEIADLEPALLDIYYNGRPRGEHPGWSSLAELYRPREGDWTVLVGIPSCGKTVFMAAMMVNLARSANWQFLVFAPENMPAQEYASMLAEIYLGKPFDDGPTPRMTVEELKEAVRWLDQHFVVLSPADGKRTLEGILEIARSYVYRRGINGLVIDPWNEVEGFGQGARTETQFICESLVRLRQFTRTYKLHTWVLVHPTKLIKCENGKLPVPTLYDCAGSANWYNKADNGLAIWRDKGDDTAPVEVHVQKVRFKWTGKLGMAQLFYDKVTGRYSESRAGGYY